MVTGFFDHGTDPSVKQNYIFCFVVDESGNLSAIRTPGNHRRYKESDINKFIGNKKPEDKPEQSVLLYSRVSSATQKTKGDLDRQNSRLAEYSAKNNYKVSYILMEVGSGMNDSRAKLQQAMKLAIEGKITKIVVEHKDRLILPLLICDIAKCRT